MYGQIQEKKKTFSDVYLINIFNTFLYVMIIWKCLTHFCEQGAQIHLEPIFPKLVFKTIEITFYQNDHMCQFVWDILSLCHSICHCSIISSFPFYYKNCPNLGNRLYEELPLIPSESLEDRYLYFYLTQNVLRLRKVDSLSKCQTGGKQWRQFKPTENSVTPKRFITFFAVSLLPYIFSF